MTPSARALSRHHSPGPATGMADLHRLQSAHTALHAPAWFLGIALGGFFDGILLHQVLQWHHLLSAVEAVRDLRWQLLADGLFHVLMYLVAAIGLWRLWRARRALAAPGATGHLWGTAAMGFGAWHVADALLSHWLLGIHRIRMDVAEPLPWDLGWLAVFGLLPLAIGAWWRWRTGPGHHSGHGPAVALALAALVAAPWAARPAGEGVEELVVVFAPGVAPARAFDALAGVDARVLWSDAGGGVWAVRMADATQAWRLYGQGALLVGQGAAAGCLGWTRPRSP